VAAVLRLNGVICAVMRSADTAFFVVVSPRFLRFFIQAWPGGCLTPGV
jgi:hypothetical protein